MPDKPSVEGTPIFLTLRRLRQDNNEFKAILSYNLCQRINQNTRIQPHSKTKSVGWPVSISPEAFRSALTLMRELFTHWPAVVSTAP